MQSTNTGTIKRMSKVLSAFAKVVVVLLLILNFNSCSKETPYSIEQKNIGNELNFLSLNPTGTSLQKKVHTTDLVTRKKGGKLKLKHEWLDENGEKVKVQVELKVKKGSINKDAEFQLNLDEQLFLGDFDVVFHPHGVVFSEPAELKIKAEGLDLSDIKENSLGLYYDNTESGEWERMEWDDFKIDKKKGKLELKNGKLPHFSRYALAWSN